MFASLIKFLKTPLGRLFTNWSFKRISLALGFSSKRTRTPRMTLYCAYCHDAFLAFTTKQVHCGFSACIVKHRKVLYELRLQRPGELKNNDLSPLEKS